MKHTLTLLAVACCLAACDSEFVDSFLSTDANSGDSISISVSADIRTADNLRALADGSNTLADGSNTLADDSEAAARSSRVSYTQSSANLNLAWEAEEHLGVYIKTTEGTFKRAGSISSSGAAGTGARTFTGKVISLNAGERYYYMHPDVSNISYTTQHGELRSTAHLNQLLPIQWAGASSNDEATTGHNAGQGSALGYVIHTTLTFNEDPGTVQRITIQTMDRDGGDMIFASQFRPTTQLPSTPNKSISLEVSGANTAVQDGTVWKVEAYLACSHIDKDVFKSKYNVEVQASGGLYRADYYSFPGQETLFGDDAHQEMLADGKCYNLNRSMSKGAATTVINQQFRVNSLTGMWNNFGKAVDPFNLIITDDARWPAQLRSNRAAICAAYKQGNESAAPTFVGPAEGSIYDLTAKGLSPEDHEQNDVRINNITLSEPTEVYLTFLSEYTAAQNLLGYYHYNPAIIDPDQYAAANHLPVAEAVPIKQMVFPNISKAGHVPFNKGDDNDDANIGYTSEAPLYEFETVQLIYTDLYGYTSTTFPAGTTLGFVLMVDPKANEKQPHETYSLFDWKQWRLFTNTNWNSHNHEAYYGAFGFVPYVNWPGAEEQNFNFFASADVCNGSTPIPGLAFYGVKDQPGNTAPTAYSSVLFLVSTSNPAALQTQNKAYFNIDPAGPVVKAKP